MTAKKRESAHERITDAFIDDVCSRLAQNRRIRRTLPEGGRLHIDRQLPFLCLYRQPVGRADPGTSQLVSGEPAFLIAPGDGHLRSGLARLVQRIVAQMSEEFGAFLLVEIWTAADGEPARFLPDAAPSLPIRMDAKPAAGLSLSAGGVVAKWRPGFAICTRGPTVPTGTIYTLQKSLEKIRVHRQRAEVEVRSHSYARPPGLPPLLGLKDAGRFGCRMLGLEVRPIFRDASADEVFSPTLRVLRRGLSRALEQAFFTFTRSYTKAKPQHHHALGRRAMVKAVWEVDRQLAAIAHSFDFLLQVTPVNAEAAWRAFRRDLFQVPPEFVYRPLSFEPSLAKRRLYAVPVERTEDPSLADLFYQRQDEIDRQITMMSDVGTARFVHGSLQVYGGVPSPLLMLAHQLLSTLPPHTREESAGKQVGAHQFAELAAAEIAEYRKQYPSFCAKVSIREDLYSGLMVSRDTLLVGRQVRVPAKRVDALLQHEVGTHLVTYFNGHSQRFAQLHTGLAGYEALQEGLAVLAEYLVEGLSRARMRLLAARVVAAHQMIEGASLVDTFRLLCRTYGFAQRIAYTIAMRVYRGGGLTKDVVYLRGLVEVLDYLRGGGDVEPLLVGKIAVEHLPLVRELQHREVLRPAPLRPRYLDRPAVKQRLARLRQGLTVADLLG
ncbi:MAG: flavohemoglobin expression-modulating QEGLA motif protein [Thermoguttaceae bacterium]|nr:flavohemoglobin expression-modulating QEGLA motif protein [Thermoguttaceae bacterium]